ncbi:MAG TPA: hypothetical protein DCQ37_20000 [Desulfobacteraceae bacterium]|nr:hypothetical protein [Desulfobacteraceae bacterium]
MNTEEKTILDECAKFNRCERLFLKYFKKIRSMVVKTFQIRCSYFTDDEVEELRNQVFVDLLENERKKLRQYDPSLGVPLTGWLKVIVNSTVGMYLRKKSTDESKRKGVISIDELKEELGMTDDEKRYEARDMLNRIKEAITLKQLPHQEGLVLQLHFFDGLPLPEVSSFMNLNINNVNQIKHRAVNHLQEIFSIM